MWLTGMCFAFSSGKGPIAGPAIVLDPGTVDLYDRARWEDEAVGERAVVGQQGWHIVILFHYCFLKGVGVFSHSVFAFKMYLRSQKCLGQARPHRGPYSDCVAAHRSFP